MTLTDFINTSQSRLEQSFVLYLNKPNFPAISLQKAVQYALLNGGKHIRPLLIYLTGRALNAPWENLDAAACAIELIHSYSLVHDDLPAMDNADLRRGKPSCHKAFNEALAILAGDAMQPLAFEIIAHHPSDLSAQQRIEMIAALCIASGVQGMAAGQVLDIEGVSSIESLNQMYNLKTGALLKACVTLGTIAAGIQSKEMIHSLEKFADCIGLAFQIQDDLLDAEGSEVTGKPQGIDHSNQKITYPILLGVDQTRKIAQNLFDQALQEVKAFPLLTEFAYYLLQRKK